MGFRGWKGACVNRASRVCCPPSLLHMRCRADVRRVDCCEEPLKGKIKKNTTRLFLFLFFLIFAFQRSPGVCVSFFISLC